MRISKILSGLAGVVCTMDDELIFRQDREEHKVKLEAALTLTKSAGITLNRDNCLFGQEKIQFLGHVIDKNDIAVDLS